MIPPYRPMAKVQAVLQKLMKRLGILPEKVYGSGAITEHYLAVCSR
jgi:hypothetical protein